MDFLISILIIIGVFIVIFLNMYVVNYFFNGNIYRLSKWVRNELFFFLSINFLMLIYQYNQTGEWFPYRSSVSAVFYMNLAIIALVFPTSLMLKKYKPKKSRGVLRYGIEYHDRNIDYLNERVQGKGEFSLSLFLTLIPILNIISIFEFVKEYLI